MPRLAERRRRGLLRFRELFSRRHRQNLYRDPHNDDMYTTIWQPHREGSDSSTERNTLENSRHLISPSDLVQWQGLGQETVRRLAEEHAESLRSNGGYFLTRRDREEVLGDIRSLAKLYVDKVTRNSDRDLTEQELLQMEEAMPRLADDYARFLRSHCDGLPTEPDLARLEDFVRGLVAESVDFYRPLVRSNRFPQKQRSDTNRQHGNLQCPICKKVFEPIADHNHDESRTSKICGIGSLPPCASVRSLRPNECSHGARKLFGNFKIRCPICKEDCRDAVALACGHVFCQPDFERLGGHIGSRGP